MTEQIDYFLITLINLQFNDFAVTYYLELLSYLPRSLL